ncbi:ABC transporter ATP-binding protein [Jiangella mangrovi]|uniref:Oligopeptide/dipeptide ABC transporter ATP-binding protein n=1 Tax=Jiangella mangrovi TaxID=1524084 RepID=A0A7W9LM63_9ACTN|nr:ABC transporter ATP-binding protein [Jiangella mangrovi]MBB5788834.1 oligopeptide/dipeptide ABC transporter ATP-binding protein [Jiangella mangrovi]
MPARHTPTPRLSVDGLSVTYRGSRPNPAVTGVSFSIGVGESLAIVGESGSGKSSVARSLGGLLQGKADVSWESMAIDDTRFVPGDVEAGVGGVAGRLLSYVFQEPKAYLNPSLRIGGQLCEILGIHLKLGRREAEREAVELLDHVGIPDAARRMNDYPHQLSGGLAQRVAIAMAIAPRPAVLVADEPTSSLDVTVAARVVALLRRLQRDRGMALLHITHNLYLAARSSDRVAVMYAGEFVEVGTAADVLRNGAMPYTRGLLAAAPAADGRTRMRPIPGSPPDMREPSTGCRFAPRCAHVHAGCAHDVGLRTVADGHHVRCTLVEG